MKQRPKDKKTAPAVARLPEDFLRQVLDAMPTPVLVTDASLRVRMVNRSAREAFGADVGDATDALPGMMMGCIGADGSPGGCGHQTICQDCVIRKSAELSHGPALVFRRLTRLRTGAQGANGERWLLVTTSRFEHLGESLLLLALEDVTELTELRRMVPMCAGCRKIRDDQDYWIEVERYLETQTGMSFTHGLCPDCTQRLYPELAGDAPVTPRPDR